MGARLTEDIESALAMRSAKMSLASIARTVERSEAWVTRQFELAEEKAARDADAEERARVQRLARAEAFRLAQERGRATRAARKAAEAEAKTCSIDAADYSAGVVERTFRTANGFGAAVRVGDEVGRLLFVETRAGRLEIGQRVEPLVCIWTLYVDDVAVER